MPANGNFCIDGNFSVESLDGLSEKDLRELNRVAQAKLDAINAEKRRKAELKKNYALKDISPIFKLDEARLGRSVVKWFETHSDPLYKDTYNALVKSATNIIKPKREEVYPCPLCGKFTLRVGHFGDTFAPRIAVTCESCDFTMKKKTDGKEYYAWEVFHEWLIKHGYLSEDVKFQY